MSMLAALNHLQIVISDEMAFQVTNVKDQRDVDWGYIPCLSPLQYWKGLDNFLLVTLPVALEYMINITEGGYFLS